MLAEEVDDWWINTCQVLDAATEVATWVVFNREFLRKYFPEDVRGKNEIKFLELKQELGHRVSDVKKYYKCGKSGHLVADCKDNVVTCYNYGEPGHINIHCVKPKKASIGGKVFSLTGTQNSSDERLIRGICYINSTPLIAIIDIGATHSFIVADCVKRLGLVVPPMNGEMVIKIPAKGSVTTTSVFLNCPMLIFDKYFSIDIIYFPLENLNVILGMNWLEFNHVYINCHNKSVQFLTPGEEEESGFLSTR
ncbi:uncharacterized protein LOC127096237 [Lathyrus oleraceus]|uniref:uncharacterized protein LOC127096237 n=1 Tax=Pisum sativum TaxID=3888 RepID=UPI0021D19DC0|nr:uncharacterized protein LOC127096237 [Pisum sativum]